MGTETFSLSTYSPILFVYFLLPLGGNATFSFFISLVVAPSSLAFDVSGEATRGSDNAVKLREGEEGPDSKSGSALVWKGKETVLTRWVKLKNFNAEG